MNGTFAINKPTGITSNYVVQVIKKILKPINNIKAGHGGTLDPMATGVLAIGLGDGCKQLSLYLKGSKEYRVRLKLGIATDTLDATGKVVQTADASAISQEQLQNAINKFVGHIMQVPPMYSALSVNGNRLYELARKGEHIDIPPRPVFIESIVLEKWHTPLADIRVRCGGGTYMRSLAHDIGTELGCFAHMAELVRLQHGIFSLDDCLDLEKCDIDTIKKAMAKSKKMD